MSPTTTPKFWAGRRRARRGCRSRVSAWTPRTRSRRRSRRPPAAARPARNTRTSHRFSRRGATATSIISSIVRIIDAGTSGSTLAISFPDRFAQEQGIDRGSEAEVEIVRQPLNRRFRHLRNGDIDVRRRLRLETEMLHVAGDADDARPANGSRHRSPRAADIRLPANARSSTASQWSGSRGRPVRWST